MSADAGEVITWKMQITLPICFKCGPLSGHEENPSMTGTKYLTQQTTAFSLILTLPTWTEAMKRY